MKKTTTIIALIVAGSLVAIAAMPAIRDLTYKPDVKTLAKTSLPRFSPTPHPTPYLKTEIEEIEIKAVALAPGQLWWQPLSVHADWKSPRLVGRFQAQGGKGNDITALITDDDGLINLQNGHSNGCKLWYNSGRVTTDTINAPIPMSRSYLVFGNRFSIFAHKSVTFDLKIEYERLVTP